MSTMTDGQTKATIKVLTRDEYKVIEVQQMARCRKQLLKLILDYPCLATLAAMCELRPAPWWLPTAAVDVKRRVYFHPLFARTLNDSELRFVLAHEVGHLLLIHLDRMQGLQRERANRAADRALNQVLTRISDARTPLTPPDCALFPDKGQEEWTFERLYEVEPEPPAGDGGGNGNDGDGQQPGDGSEGNGDGSDPSDGGGQGGKSGGPKKNPGQQKATSGCGVMDADEASQAENQALRAQAQIQAHAAVSVHAGTAAGDLLANLLKPPTAVIPWSRLLMRTVSQASESHGDDDVSWSRRHRRSHGSMFVMPGGITCSATVAVIIDTSGSMTDEQLAQCVAETMAVAKASSEVGIYLVTHDAVVQHAGWIRGGVNAPSVQRALKGRGGTIFEPAYDAVATCGRKFDAVVHLTDGWGSWPDAPPANCKRAIVGLVGAGCAEGPEWATNVRTDPKS